VVAENTGVAVVTDSTPYLPRELIDRWGIRQVSLYVGWDGDLRPEHSYRDLDAFYARLRDSMSLPATSQPSVGDFRESNPVSHMSRTPSAQAADRLGRDATRLR
jgi:hypothetical protein